MIHTSKVQDFRKDFEGNVLLEVSGIKYKKIAKIKGKIAQIHTMHVEMLFTEEKVSMHRTSKSNMLSGSISI